MISADTWAIVLATGFGPIGAVLITLWREKRNSLKARRLWVFRTLMATRRMSISNEHVTALNLVEVDFFGCRKVQAQWAIYKDHLFTTAVEDDEWREKKERLLANLLFEIAAELRLSIPAMEIFKGGYAPKGWAHRELRQLGAMEYIFELSQGTKCVPLWIMGMNPPPTPPQPPPLDNDRRT
jgi:hypothetical protein